MTEKKKVMNDEMAIALTDPLKEIVSALLFYRNSLAQGKEVDQGQRAKEGLKALNEVMVKLEKAEV